MEDLTKIVGAHANANGNAKFLCARGNANAVGPRAFAAHAPNKKVTLNRKRRDKKHITR